MRKFIIPCLLALSYPAFSAQAQTPWDGTADTEWAGEGTQSSHYLISTAEELAGLAERSNQDETFEGVYFQLTADIWLSDEDTPADERPQWVPIASHDINNDDQETNPGGWFKKVHYFKGTLDGAGHTIYNLWFSRMQPGDHGMLCGYRDRDLQFSSWRALLSYI